MGKLTFVGLGLGENGVSLAGIEAMRQADVAYIERYTSPHPLGLVPSLEDATGRSLNLVERRFVEDGRRILEEAKTMKVTLASQGDPMIATTHSDLRVRAISQGTETAVIHAATIPAAAASASGLHYYKFGATVTYTRESVNSHQQVYRRVHQNLLEGLHTLLLMEFDLERNQGVEPAALMRGLLEAENNFKRDVLGEKTLAVVLSRVGSSDQSIRAGAISELLGREFGSPPHCVIIPATLHFSEAEGLGAICGIGAATLPDNAAHIRRTAQVLVPRYVEKAKGALQSARSSLTDGDKNEALLENAELYIRDAESFLANGQDELAMLSAGYAEGLIDSLSFTGKIKLGW